MFSVATFKQANFSDLAKAYNNFLIEAEPSEISATTMSTDDDWFYLIVTYKD